MPRQVQWLRLAPANDACSAETPSSSHASSEASTKQARSRTAYLNVTRRAMRPVRSAPDLLRLPDRQAQSRTTLTREALERIDGDPARTGGVARRPIGIQERPVPAVSPSSAPPVQVLPFRLTQPRDVPSMRSRPSTQARPSSASGPAATSIRWTPAPTAWTSAAGQLATSGPARASNRGPR